MKPLSLSVLLLFAPLAAGSPKLDTLFPAGGQRGTSVSVTAGGTFETWPVQIWSSHPGLTVTPGKTTGQLAIAIADDVPCGTHWIRFFDKTGASGLRPFLVNQLPEIEDKEPNDDFKKPQEITQPSVIVNGRLAKNDDVDHFAVSLKKGQTLVAAVESFRTLRSPMDAVLQIVSVDGFVLAHNDDFYDVDPLVAFEAPKDDVYIVRLFCFPTTPDSRVGFFGKDTCIYRLTLTTGPFIDRTWPRAVERGRPSDVELLGWNIPTDRKQHSIKATDHDERVFLQPPGFANGTWVRAEPHRTVASQDKLGAPPVSVSGQLAKRGSRAAFTFEGAKGKVVSIAIEARESFLPLDAVLSIRDAAGKALQKIQSSKLNVDPSLDFTPPEDGVYTLEIRDLHDDGGPRHLFLARIRPTQPSFEATVAADRFEGTTNQPLDIPIAVTFRHGMKGPLEFRAEGLPESAKFEFIPGKDLAKSTVRITGVAAPFNGPVRIFANVSGQPERAVDTAEWNRPELWVTVAGK